MGTDDDLQEEFKKLLENVDINSNSTTHTVVKVSDNTSKNDPFNVPSVWNSDNVFIDHGTSTDFESCITIGSITIRNKGDGEVVISLKDKDDKKIEYYLSAEKVKNILEKLADIIITGK